MSWELGDKIWTEVSRATQAKHVGGHCYIQMGWWLVYGMWRREPGAVTYERMWHAKKSRPGISGKGTCDSRQSVNPLHEQATFRQTWNLWARAWLVLQTLPAILHRFHATVRTLELYSSSGAEEGKRGIVFRWVTWRTRCLSVQSSDMD